MGDTLCISGSSIRYQDHNAGCLSNWAIFDRALAELNDAPADDPGEAKTLSPFLSAVSK